MSFPAQRRGRTTMPVPEEPAARFGSPRVHLRRAESTNTLARELAAGEAPHGTLVTAETQSAGRGRQGRTWSAPPRSALLCSWVIREPGPLLPLAAGVAVAELCGERALLKWPNDVLVDGRKVAGVLVEGRPQERWAVLGIGINVALRIEDLPQEIRGRAGTLGLTTDELEPMLRRLCRELELWLSRPGEAVLAAVRARDALRGRQVRWDRGSGLACGVDARGRLLVELADGSRVALDAGEVHIGAS